ncbi:class I SAM-dependent methyltransferase [Haliscomenobacter hydrossis]|uniref:Methyltransferase type 11 n=1 Tax=Haliscomenobacter hydrossis (strain ATCC 27775 / DSM 1100 / LMG 10767 / O) TaxID=760192 RepID=F4KZH4_HALH1|nr:class I SAM-dependent methyltransferase [Haliscomenobacter hydrossis]AEE49444.1 Methyltransferase type 11 [Haliscomenobacter hydrossis DSM 1100]
MLKFLKKIFTRVQASPAPQLIAAQLRKPSGVFAKQVGKRMNESNRLLYELVLQHLDVQAGNQVLEIGFGNGKFFKDVLLKAEQLKLYGLDFSEQMAQEARKNNTDLIQKGVLDVQMGSSEKLPYNAEMFDAVFCINVIYFWESPATHLQEIRRVLKPGGKFYIGVRPKSVLEKLPFAEHGFHLRDTPEIEAMLQQNGFSLLNTHQQTEPPVTMYGATYDMQGMCMVFEKKA